MYVSVREYWQLEDRKKLDEIAITDEMVDAGLAAYDECDARYMRDSSIVIAIYEAMHRARPECRAAPRDDLYQFVPKRPLPP